MNKLGVFIRNRTAGIRAALGKDRGALMNALVLVMVGTTGLVIALSWFMFRSTIDYNTGQQAKIQSSIGQLATNVLGVMNQDFPDDWQFMNAEDLAEATQDLGATNELGATSTITFFAINPTTGVVTAEATGTSTTRSTIISQARIQFVPSGAGVFKGTDEVGRPLWVYSDDNLDALALWELNPNSIEYLTPGGDYTSEAPPSPPAVNITGSGSSATAAFSNVYCQFGGTAEYRFRYKYGNGEWTPWSDWATAQNSIQDIEQGQRISFQAMARCSTSLGNTDATAASDIAEYVHPILPPAGAPDLTISSTGVATWSAIECVQSTTAQYQYRTRISESSWSTWVSWTPGLLEHVTGATEGARVEVQVRARCASEFATGATTSTASASRDLPITSIPVRPVVTFNGGTSATISVASAASVPGLTAEYRFAVSVNDSTVIWGDWAPQNSLQRTFNQGSRVQVQAEARYVSNYVVGPSSATSLNTTLNVPVTSIPAVPILTLNAGFSSWGFNDVGCVAGTTTGYTWSVTVGGATVSSDTYAAFPGAQNISIPQGQQFVATVRAACVGYNDLKGPYSAPNTLERLRDVTSVPSIPSVNFTPTGGASWTSAGCPAGTTWQSRHRWQSNVGGFGAWTGWSTTSSISSPIGQGERVSVDTEARCTSVFDANMSGPSANFASPWHVHEIVSQPTTGGSVVLTGNGPVTATFTNPTSCPATTSVRVAQRTTIDGTAWPAASAFSTSIAPQSIAASQGQVARAQLAAYCMTAYSQGPTFWYTAVASTTPVTATPTGTSTVTWAANHTFFQFSAQNCASGLTPQYSWRTSLGSGWSGFSSYAGMPSSVAISGWTPGGTHWVQVGARCANLSSGAVGPATFGAEVNQVNPLGTPTTPVITRNADSSTSWTVGGCAVATGIVTETRSRARGNGGTGAWNNEGIGWNGWSGWSTTVRNLGIIVSEGHSGQVQVEARCLHQPSGTAGPTSGTATNGWTIRGVSAPSMNIGMPRPRTVSFGGSCQAATWLVHVSMRVSNASGVHPYGVYQPNVGSWGTEIVNGSTWGPNYAGHVKGYCQGAYTSSGWGNGTFQVGSRAIPWH